MTAGRMVGGGEGGGRGVGNTVHATMYKLELVLAGF